MTVDAHLRRILTQEFEHRRKYFRTDNEYRRADLDKAVEQIITLFQKAQGYGTLAELGTPTDLTMISSREFMDNLKSDEVAG